MATESKKAEASKAESPKPESPNPQSKKPVFTCPECEAKGIKTNFKDKRGLGVHRRAAHGVVGTSPSTVAYHQKRESSPKKNHHKKAASVAATPTAVAIIPKEKPAEQFSAVMIGYAMGKLESLAMQIARENKLPEQDFVRVAAYNFAELTKR